MQELELITKAKNGDRRAFCDLYGLYKDRLYRYAFYRLGSHPDAEDAVSDCVLSMWKQIGRLREPEAFAGWLFRIMAACCSKAVKKQNEGRNLVPLDESFEAAGKCPGQDTGARESGSYLILQEAIEKLSEQERNIMLLSVIGGLKSNEISEITGLEPGSVRSSLSRSLKKVRGYLE